jgi:Icc-related predicted phosphoesterase
VNLGLRLNGCIAVVGDVHGDIDHFKWVVNRARKHAGLIVQVGDFGFMPKAKWFAGFIAEVDAALASAGMAMLWIDGNHDDHDSIRNREWPVTDEGLLRTSKHTFHWPRGLALTIGDCRCIGLGGAYSIDKDWRLEQEQLIGEDRILWWEEELISPDEEARTIAAAPADLMFCHDAPTEQAALLTFAGFKNDPASTANNAVVQRAMEAISPAVLFHGHFHRAKATVASNGTMVVGLGDNRTKNTSWDVVNTVKDGSMRK